VSDYFRIGVYGYYCGMVGGEGCVCYIGLVIVMGENVIIMGVDLLGLLVGMVLWFGLMVFVWFVG